MKEIIVEAVKQANTLNEVRDSLFGVFKNFRLEGHDKIGYVSGIITSEGPDNIPKNIERLARFTAHVRATQAFPVFSATDVFDDVLFARLNAAGFKNEDWLVFWREVLGDERKFVTDMFMTPRWEISQGATDEHQIAKAMNMSVSYLDYEF